MNVTFTVDDLAAAADAALPYAMDGDTRRRAKRWPIRVTAAGGVNTSIASFANWLRLHLDKGEFAGQRLLSPALIQQLQTPRVHVAASEFAEYSDAHYGLGFASHSYRGERVVSAASSWRSLTLTGRPGKRRGGQTPGPATTSPIMPAITTIPATAGSPSPMPKAN